MNEALRDWVTNVRTTYYCIGSTAGPHPYPMMVRDFQSVIGREARRQARRRACPTCWWPAWAAARTPSASSIPFIGDRPGAADRGGGGGRRASAPGGTRRPSRGGLPASCTAACRYILQDEDGQVRPAHSISAGLDYPGVGPEHSWLKDTGRAEYVAVTDEEALEAFELLARLEGIIPALESAHAIAHAIRLAATPAAPRPGS